MDAPVSGGVPAAANATLTFMVGGDKFPECESVLRMMGGRIVHCGGVGTGQAAKLCNNMLLATSMIATAESMNMGIKLGWLLPFGIRVSARNYSSVTGLFILI